ncbi:MAG: peptide-methionine (S)-S-oxide reductase MsrA [Myxococcota bacterium]
MRGFFVSLVCVLAACSSPSEGAPAKNAVAGKVTEDKAATPKPSADVKTPAEPAAMDAAKDTKDAERPKLPPSPAEVPGEQVAYFAGGCFWGVEHYMSQIDGVIAVEAGYMGEPPTPQAEQYETVQVRFDPSKASYRDVAKRFFEIHDPTQADGQGPDIGPEYRSAVFYGGPGQKEATESLIEELKGKGFAVVTKVEPITNFSRAADKHQDYYARTGKEPYCHSRVRRFED